MSLQATINRGKRAGLPLLEKCQMKCHWIVRCVLGVVIAVVISSGSAMAQQTGGGAGGPGGGATGGTGGGTTGGAQAETGTTEQNITDNTEESSLSQTMERVMNVSGDRARDLRTNGVGRIGIMNNFGTGNPNLVSGESLSTNATTGAGPVGAGVHFLDSQGQSRYGTTTSNSSRTTGATGGAGRTATGLGGGGGMQGMNNAFGGTGGLGGLGSTTTARIPLMMGEGLSLPTSTARSSNLVSAQIRSLPALARSPQVQVQTEGRVVTLSGSVATQREADQLVRTVKMRSGVGGVVNRIVVREQSSPSDQPQQN